MVLATSQHGELTKDAYSSSAVVALLSDARTYPQRPREVTVIETHISWVFLTDRHAFKLKKPVKFDFLDYSTPELRCAACQQELALNRRLAGDVYLEVVPITISSHGRLRLGGGGTPVDWVVKMRRLPAERTLSRLIECHGLSDAELDQIAVKLANFYGRLPPLSTRTERYRQQLETHVQENRRELLAPRHELDTALVERVHAAQLRALRIHPETFDDRVCDGRLVEGHGDLRPEHIYLTGGAGPVIIDAIEFNAELRQLDVLDELGFLAMECAYLGAAQVGGRILQRYCEVSGDTPPPELVPFYNCYRACVRAKVHALRAQQVESGARGADRQAALAYLRLADRYADELGPPLLLIVRGLSGTGKSTLAAALAEALGIGLLQTDAIRRDRFGASSAPAAYESGIYRPQQRLEVYDEMFRLAGKALDDRRSIVLDGTFLSSLLRAQAASLARRHAAAPLLVHCYCEDEVVAERISARRAAGESLSEARPEFLVQQRAHEEADPPGLAVSHVDTNASLPAMLQQVYDDIRLMLRDARYHAGHRPV